jgi:uncharacterized LabA/DUF88 family protein
MLTAVLVDGTFFLKRYRSLFSYQLTPSEIAKNLHTICLLHLSAHYKKEQNSLYRILFYDCEPLSKKIHHPLTGKLIDLSKTKEYCFRTAFYSELKKLRKVALRLGYIQDHNEWIISPDATKKLLKGDILIDDLDEHDVIYKIAQKAVDMKIGLDIASLCLKKLVGQIVLISGDSDFVPAAKLARREGIDFILDSMGMKVRDDLHEHIDGFKSTYLRLLHNKPSII